MHFGHGESSLVSLENHHLISCGESQADVVCVVIMRRD